MNHCFFLGEACYGYKKLLSSTGFEMRNFRIKNTFFLFKNSVWSFKLLSAFDESKYLRYLYIWIEGHFILGGNFHKLEYSEGNYFLKESLWIRTNWPYSFLFHLFSKKIKYTSWKGHFDLVLRVFDILHCVLIYTWTLFEVVVLYIQILRTRRRK